MNPEVEAYLLRAKESIEAAKLLLEHHLANIAVSRAYYAMFYSAEAVLLSQGLKFGKHSAVVAKFGELLIAPGHLPIQLHRYLIDAQDDRHKGDYSPSFQFSPLQAAEHIAHAEEFLAAVRAFLSSPPETA